MKRLVLVLAACGLDKIAPDAAVDAPPPPGCVETFDDGSGPQPIFVANSLVLNRAGTLTLCAHDYTADIVATHDLTVVGLGRDLTAIDASHVETALTVSAGATVTVQDLTITNGVARTQIAGVAAGGNVQCTGATLSLTRVKVTKGEAELGGNVFASDCTLTVTDSEISAGSANDSDGGGLALQAGSATLTNATVLSNTAAGRGGGIAVLGSASVSVVTSHIQSNTSATDGGGLLIEGSATCDASAIDANKSFGVALAGSAAQFTSQSCNYPSNTPHDVSVDAQTFDFDADATFTCTAAGCQ